MTLAALHSRDFRLYWIALIVSAIGTWMQIVAQGLLVLQLSHGSAAPLGLVALAQSAAFLLCALAGGTVVDRMDRRRLLLLTQSILMVLAFVIGLLTTLHLIRIWTIVVLAFLSGVVLSIDQPARSTFLPSLVPQPDLPSAISLQSIVFTGSGALAPPLAGLSIAYFGFAGNFFFNAASYLVANCVLFSLRHRSGPSILSRRSTGLRQSIWEGIRIVKSDPLLTWAVSGYAAMLFAAPSMQILLPVIAVHVLHVNSSWLGLLFAAFGVGSVGGALLVPRFGGHDKPYLVYLACFAVGVTTLSLVASTHWFVIYMGALICLGAAQGALSTLVITLLQSRVAKDVRGRMMSLQTLLNMGIRPLGDFPLSLLMTRVGARSTAAISAVLIGGYGLYMASTASKWQAHPVDQKPQ